MDMCLLPEKVRTGSSSSSSSLQVIACLLSQPATTKGRQVATYSCTPSCIAWHEIGKCKVMA